MARVTARDWSITSRGFAEQSPNKLLVLVDGRAVYSPLFAGTVGVAFSRALAVPDVAGEVVMVAAGRHEGGHR